MSHLAPVGSLELAKLALTNLTGPFECGRQEVRPNLASALPDGYGEINPKYLGSVASGVTGLVPSQNWLGVTASVQPALINSHQKSLISQSRYSLRPGFGSSWMSQS